MNKYQLKHANFKPKTTKGQIFKRGFLTIIVISACLFIFNWAIETGQARYQKRECAKLEKQTQKYQGFYYADWQKTMCNIK